MATKPKLRMNALSKNKRWVTIQDNERGVTMHATEAGISVTVYAGNEANDDALIPWSFIDAMRAATLKQRRDKRRVVVIAAPEAAK